MRKKEGAAVVLLLSALLFVPSPDPAPSCAGMTLADAVADVARRTQAMDSAGLAALFGPDGESRTGGRTLRGEAEIRGFMQGFAAYRVTRETMAIDGVNGIDGGWRTAGRFAQDGTTPEGAAYHSAGRFIIDWRCPAGGAWRIARMETLA